MDDIPRRNVVLAGCQHLIPRPAGWRDNIVQQLVQESLGIVSGESLQARLDNYARELGTAYFTTMELTIGDPRLGARKMLLQCPTLVCPDCEPRLAMFCDLAGMEEEANQEAERATRPMQLNA